MKLFLRILRFLNRLPGKIKFKINYHYNTFLLDSCKSRLPELVMRMAETGFGTDECLELGCLPMKVHYYSPVPDIKDLEQREIWKRKSLLSGIDFRPADQAQLMLKLGSAYGSECDWSNEKTDIPSQFYLNNGRFSYGCAASLHSIIRYYKPRRIIEAGSGMSSMVISAALQKNNSEPPNLSCDYTIIDPYPGEVVSNGLLENTHLVKDRVELVDISIFDKLEENDILFIDSSHTVRIGGDVNFIFLEVLPRLKPGVIVHFHDIHLPYEYPKVYYTGNPQFRVFWTEAYLLQAFLINNSEFEVLLGLSYLMAEKMDDFCKAFPPFKLAENWSNSGSFWIRRKTKFS